MSLRRKYLFELELLTSFCDTCKLAIGTCRAVCDVNEQELERRWTKLVQIYEEVMTTEDEELNKDLMQSAPKSFTNACDKYKQCKASINKLKLAKQPKNDDSFNNSFMASSHSLKTSMRH